MTTIHPAKATNTLEGNVALAPDAALALLPLALIGAWPEHPTDPWIFWPPSWTRVRDALLSEWTVLYEGLVMSALMLIILLPTWLAQPTGSAEGYSPTLPLLVFHFFCNTVAWTLRTYLTQHPTVKLQLIFVFIRFPFYGLAWLAIVTVAPIHLFWVLPAIQWQQTSVSSYFRFRWEEPQKRSLLHTLLYYQVLGFFGNLTTYGMFYFSMLQFLLSEWLRDVAWLQILTFTVVYPLLRSSVMYFLLSRYNPKRYKYRIATLDGYQHHACNTSLHGSRSHDGVALIMTYEAIFGLASKINLLRTETDQQFRLGLLANNASELVISTFGWSMYAAAQRTQRRTLAEGRAADDELVERAADILTYKRCVQAAEWQSAVLASVVCLLYHTACARVPVAAPMAAGLLGRRVAEMLLWEVGTDGVLGAVDAVLGIRTVHLPRLHLLQHGMAAALGVSGCLAYLITLRT